MSGGKASLKINIFSSLKTLKDNSGVIMAYGVKSTLSNCQNTMRKVPVFLTIAIGLFLCIADSHAQFSMVYSAGISPQQSPNGHYIFVNQATPRDEFTFNLAQVKASYFIGAGTRYDVKPFFFTGEAQYNKREYVYNVEYTYPDFVRSEETIAYNETMHMINVPVSIGVDLGVMEVTSGFLPQFVVSHKSDLENISGYSEKLNPVRFGWQSGLAAKVANFRIGLNYQMDFNNYADHMAVNGDNLSLSGRSSRFVGMFSAMF